jgi:ubiquinone biosynthesis protein UbiJ
VGEENSGTFLSETVSLGVVLGILGSVIGFAGLVLWGFLTYRIEALESGRTTPMAVESRIRVTRLEDDLNRLNDRVGRLEQRIDNLERKGG